MRVPRRAYFRETKISNSYSLVFMGARPGRIALILTFYFTSNRIIYEIEYQDSWAPWDQVYQTP
jgi:hypothetical protein